MALRGNVYLIGPMGSGKSAVGRELSRLLRRPFVDTDAWIERRSGASVARLFERRGEAAFRRLERQAVRAAARRRGLVVALGGGAPAQPGVRSLLAASGLTVRLTCSQRALWRRLSPQRERRPLLRGRGAAESRARLAALLRRRAPLFPRGELRLSTTRLSAREAARRIARWLEAP
ncbi:MAG: ATP-binding protein [Elusimicrobia bacterium]|nr:ATP-binding protein [Elusimicrobiota bacterium]